MWLSDAPPLSAIITDLDARFPLLSGILCSLPSQRSLLSARFRRHTPSLQRLLSSQSKTAFFTVPNPGLPWCLGHFLALVIFCTRIFSQALSPLVLSCAIIPFGCVKRFNV